MESPKDESFRLDTDGGFDEVKPMDKSSTGNVVAFVSTLYQMVNNPENSAYVWGPGRR